MVFGIRRGVGVFAGVLASVGVAPLAVAQGFGSTSAVGSGEVFLSESGNPYVPGRVVIYRHRGTEWKEAGRLTAPTPAPLDRFGRSLSFSEGRLLVGATSIDSSRGAAYLFERDGNGSWQRAASLIAAGSRAGDAYGRVVVLAGDEAFVASWGAGESRGAVTVWRRGPAGTWGEVETLTASDARPRDTFGSALAVAGDLLVVGAAQRDTAAGAAFIYRRDPATKRWREEGQVLGAGAGRGARFGAAVAITGDRVLVGAPGMNRRTGKVFLFHRTAGGAWEESAQLAAPDTTPNLQFGTAIAVAAGDEIWIGAPGGGTERSGQVYRFTVTGDTWGIREPLGVSGIEANDGLGAQLSVAGPVAVVGLPNDDHGMGTAIVLAAAPTGTWSASPKLLVESEGLAAMTGAKVECRDAKVGVFGCNGVDLLAFVPIPSIGGERGIDLNDIWGWTDPTTQREYALVGRTDGTAFVDVTDPVHPRFLGSLPRTAGTPVSSWRDIKVYKDHAFIVADAAQAHGMQVFDLTKLRTVAGAPATFTEDAHYDRIQSAHNIVIDTTTGYAYIVGGSSGGETCGGALHMVDIRNPLQPAFSGCFADPATGLRKTGYTHDAQCVVYHGPDQEHRGREICFNSSETALGIADVTDKASPRILSSAAYPNVAYAHQGWLSEDQRYFFMDDEGDEMSGTVAGTRTLVWDLSDLDDPVLAKEYISTNRAIDHNLYIKGNLMYQSNYTSGLRILDVSDPTNPKPVGFFDTMPVGEDTPEFAGTWSNYPFFKSGTIIVSSIGEGLFVLQKSTRPLVP